ncbi:MAG TPA: HAMP domain-containing sensor histidine kinase [Acidimicrobiales bacterium]|nr:HAMP domain-containing sensor histidine kinase [Acidimicrobiales bacterium]
MRTTVRLRLTLVYGALFVLAGAVLLTLNYAMVRRNLPVDQVVFRAPVPSEGHLTFPPPGQVFEGPLGPEIVVNGEPIAPEELRDLPQKVRDKALHQLVVQSASALGIMAVVSVGLGWLMAGRVLRPLKDMSATARRLSERNLHERIALDGPDDELKELADTFDAMLGRLDAAFDSQRRFVANASHELRTPLAIMRAELEVTMADPAATAEQMRSMGARMGQAIARSERLIDSLLTLAGSERQLEHVEEADLAAAAEVALAQAGTEAGALDVRIERVLDPAPVMGDAALLEQLATNLVDNAIRYNRREGWVHVTTGLAGDQALLRVANTGEVVPPEEVDSLFEPFRRLGADRTTSRRGAGLGLSIVRAVALAHGGQVRARAFGEGGLEISVTIPSSGERGGGRQN